MATPPRKPFSIVAQATNRRAHYQYELLKSYEAGLALEGREVKAIKQGKANLQDAYCRFQQGELWMVNLHISSYQPRMQDYDPLRPRKLLLRRQELQQLKRKKEEKGLTLIPLRLFLSPRGWVKAEVVLAKGKKLYQKKQAIKERDLTRYHEELSNTRD